MNISISQLIKDAREDPSLLSTINTDDLIETAKNTHIENQSFDSIAIDVFNSLKPLGITKQTMTCHLDKLSGYRFVDELHLLHKGKYVRWIRHDAPEKLTKGGIVIDVQFGDFGANILCRLVTGNFLRYRFDQCNTYQKLTEEECMILTLYRLEVGV